MWCWLFARVEPSLPKCEPVQLSKPAKDKSLVCRVGWTPSAIPARCLWGQGTSPFASSKRLHLRWGRLRHLPPATALPYASPIAGIF